MNDDKKFELWYVLITQMYFLLFGLFFIIDMFIGVFGETHIEPINRFILSILRNLFLVIAIYRTVIISYLYVSMNFEND